MDPTPRRAFLSVDVEDYFHVEAFSTVVKTTDWQGYRSRVCDNTRRLLDLFDSIGVKRTFFVLGWVAERNGDLVREIASRGHELACHSYWHRLIFNLTSDEFREDTRRAKDVIEQAAGVAVYGYRAPSFSVTKRSFWALDVLASLGFRYDSSIFSIKHDVYGVPDAPRTPFTVATESGPIVEYPMTTFRVTRNGPNMPVGGGGYLRIFPFAYTKFGISKAMREGIPVITYIHPWEIDPEQPRINARFKSRLRHYTNLGKTKDRLRRLLGLASFTSFRDGGVLSAPHTDLQCAATATQVR